MPVMELSTTTWARPLVTERIAIPGQVNSRNWNETICQLGGGNVLQSNQWGDVKASLGWIPQRVAHYRGGVPTIAMQLLLRRTPLGTFAYVPRGPVDTSLESGLASSLRASTLTGLLEEVHLLARAAGAAFLKIEPPWMDGPINEQLLRDAGFRSSTPVQPRSTIVLSLQPEPGVLLSQLSTRTRYNVGLAARRGVTIDHGTRADLPAFHRLLQETGQRGHFPVRPAAYYESIWDQLAPAGMAHLFLARHQGETLSAALVLTMGRAAYYMYGASSTTGRNVKPSDLLQWHAIQWARERGCQTYDLWGIPDEAIDQSEEQTAPAGSASQSLWGVYHFKRGFGGQKVRFVGAYDYVYSWPRYWLWQKLTPRLRQIVEERQRRKSGDAASAEPPRAAAVAE